MALPLSVTDPVRVGLCAAAAGVALAGPRVPERWRTPLLGALAAVALANAAGFDPDPGGVDAYDVAHYYLGAKYAEELGSAGLGPCLLAVDADRRRPVAPATYRARAPGGAYAVRPAAEGVAEGRALREARFSPERWAAFAHDARWLLDPRRLPPDGFRALVLDHGVHASPAWLSVGRPLASAVPVEAVAAVGLGDLALLAGALALVGRASGARAALWLGLWMALSFCLRWPPPGRGFLRYEWLAGLLVAQALLRLGRGTAAAALLGVVTATRVVPGFSAVGLPRTPAAAAAFGGALAATALAGVAGVGVGPARDWLDALRAQQSPAELPSRAVGLAVALGWDGNVAGEPSPGQRARLAAQAPAALALGLAGAAALAWRSRARPPEERVAHGALVQFLLSAPEYYYAATRGTLVVTAAAGDGAGHRAVLAGVFALEGGLTAVRTAAPAASALLGAAHAWGLVGLTCAFVFADPFGRASPTAPPAAGPGAGPPVW